MKRRTLLAAGVTLMTGCVGGGAQVDEDAPPQERLRQRVGGVIDSSTIGVSPAVGAERDNGGFTVFAEYAVDTNLGADGTKNLTDKVAYDAAKAVYQDDATVISFGINGTLTVENQYGETSQADLTTVVINEESAERVVWENTDYTDIQDFADEYVFRSRYF
jgi:ABC-type Na+ efflux pump permease subunit